MHALLAIAATILPMAAIADASDEKLGAVSFSVSCAPAVRPSFDRGVALLHDFWYEEAQRQFGEIAKADPQCAMAHWGIAMSVFHQIWDRPDEAADAGTRRCCVRATVSTAAENPDDRGRGH